ncbi:MAG: hypothetical protein JWM86_55 [Thermoleophilia bacterium]|nr:hypothetical protein [Thermoleophilia bacterium]
MGPAALLDELRDGLTPAARVGLFVLLLGAMVMSMVVVLLSPSVAGMVGLPGHALQAPTAQVQPARAAPARPALTKAQRAKARRTAVYSAATQVGFREVGGANRGGRVTTYRRAVTGRGERASAAEPWCADFVSWAWRRAGQPLGFDGRGSDYVPELVAWARITHRWHWARDGYRPKPGDLIVFRSGGSTRGHVGMVARVSRGRVHTIEGNLRDRVMRRTVKPWAPDVTGFIAPV